jgi:hypothetical protein
MHCGADDQDLTPKTAAKCRLQRSKNTTQNISPLNHWHDRQLSLTCNTSCVAAPLPRMALHFTAAPKLFY